MLHRGEGGIGKGGTTRQMTDKDGYAWNWQKHKDIKRMHSGMLSV